MSYPNPEYKLILAATLKPEEVVKLKWQAKDFLHWSVDFQDTELLSRLLPRGTLGGYKEIGYKTEGKIYNMN